MLEKLNVFISCYYCDYYNYECTANLYIPNLFSLRSHADKSISVNELVFNTLLKCLFHGQVEAPELVVDKLRQQVGALSTAALLVLLLLLTLLLVLLFISISILALVIPALLLVV